MNETTTGQKVTNYYGKLNRLKSKVRSMEIVGEQLGEPLVFVTATLNAKYGKDRENIETIRNSVKNAIKRAKTIYYVFVIEQHKKGGYHAHLILTKSESVEFVKNYTSGFTKIIEKYGNIDNELSKYLAKQDKNRRYHFSSWALNRVNEVRTVENKRYYLENEYGIIESEQDKKDYLGWFLKKKGKRK